VTQENLSQKPAHTTPRKANRQQFTTLTISAAIALTAMTQAHAQIKDSLYPRMAPTQQYMMAPDAETALARTAAPDSISRDAEILLLGPHGYNPTTKGTNGFTCLVLRSWTAGLDDTDFWNPKLRGPICLNSASVRSYLPK